MDENRRARRLPRPATVLAAIAVFAALAGTATAANSLIKGSEIKPGTITAKQLKNKTITTNKLSKAAINQLQGAKGATGAKGAVGPKGASGARGPEGPKGETGPAGIVQPFFGEDDDTQFTNPGQELVVLTVPVSKAGSFVINAKTVAFTVEDDGEVECWLEIGDDTVDQSAWYASTAGTRSTLAMQAVASASPSDPIEVHCGIFNSNGAVEDTKLTAIPVG